MNSRFDREREKRRWRWWAAPTSLWLGALAIGLVGGTPSARGAAPADRCVGTVIALPRDDYSFVLSANVTRNLRVRLLHRSRFAAARFQAEILTIAIQQPEKDEPAGIVFLPTNEAGEPKPIYRELNAKDLLRQRAAIQTGEIRVAMVQVNPMQPASTIPGRCLFFLAPIYDLAALRAQNPEVMLRIVHHQQTAIGSFPVPVALLAIDESDADRLEIPTPTLLRALLQMNPNVIPGPGIVSGNRRVATVVVQTQELP